MDEAYKILPKEIHKHWDTFKATRGEKIVNFVRSRLGEKVDMEEFIGIYKNLTRATSRKRRAGKRTYQYLKKWNWIK